MPVCYALDEKLDLIYVNPQDVTTTQEFGDCIEAYSREPAFHPRIDVLLDLRSMTEYELGEDAVIEKLTHTIDQTRGGKTDYSLACVVRARWEETFVSMSDDLLYRADRAKSFYEVEEALRWLGHDGEEARGRVAAMRRQLEAQREKET